jgi:uncharacterized membrane protein
VTAYVLMGLFAVLVAVVAWLMIGGLTDRRSEKQAERRRTAEQRLADTNARNVRRIERNRDDRPDAM